MPNTLLEANFPTVNLRSIYTQTVNTNTASTESSADTKDANTILAAKLASLGFNDDIIKKLISFGEPFKKVCTALGFKLNNATGGNPILAFVNQTYVQEKLLKTDLLNSRTFKVIYNAVAKKLVADSEFFTERTYNIIYCQDLYSKSVQEMEEYLILQRSILSPTAQSYDGQTQLKNRQVFLSIDNIKNSNGEKELDPNTYVKKVKAITLDDKALPTVFNAKLNSIAVAKAISGSKQEEPKAITKSNKELIAILKKLTTIEDKLAVIMSLSASTNSKKAQQALVAPELGGVSGDLVTKAFLRLSKDGILPKGQLSTETADTLVGLIMATLKSKEEADI